MTGLRPPAARWTRGPATAGPARPHRCRVRGPPVQPRRAVPGAVAEMEEDFDEIEKDLRAQADEQLRGSGAAWEFERRQGTIADQLIAGPPPSAKPTRMRTWRSSSAARPTPRTAWSVRSRSAWPATRRCRSSSCRRRRRAHNAGSAADYPRPSRATALRRSWTGMVSAQGMPAATRASGALQGARWGSA
jgi:hypothetical protein